MDFSVQVTSNLFGELARSLPGKAAAVVAEAAARIEAGAKAACPVDTGELAGSIHTEPTGPLSAQVVAGTDHCLFVEYGTGARGAASSFPGKPEGITYKNGWPGMKAQPFMTPAAEAEKPRFVAAIAGALGHE